MVKTASVIYTPVTNQTRIMLQQMSSCNSVLLKLINSTDIFESVSVPVLRFGYSPSMHNIQCWKETFSNTHVKLLNENGNSWRQTGYCFRLAKLVLFPINACSELSANCVTIVSRSFITILLPRETWDISNNFVDSFHPTGNSTRGIFLAYNYPNWCPCVESIQVPN
jgi:hypothetical protein